jgi:octaprenyl-diphosphate synthase
MNLASHLTLDFDRLNLCINRQLYSDVALVQQVATYIVQAGGKRMRPAMLLLAADVLGLREDARATELAAIVEFIHTATLLHDDVVDESHQRRGKQTANAVFGNAASVLVGDFLYSRAFQMMVTLESPRVMTVLADATNIIAEGEVLQLMHIGDADLSQAQYLQVIEYKTAKLFEAAARLPAVLAGDAVAEVALATYGRKVGAAFQIVDDVLDYQGDSALLGKNLGDDLREGKVTLPLIYAIAQGTESQKQCIVDTINAMQADGMVSNDEAVLAHRLAQVVSIVQKTGAIEMSMLMAKDLVAQALLALDRLQNTQNTHALNALRELANQAINRQL